MSMSEISIRHVEPSDLEGVRALYAQQSSYAGTLQLPHPKSALWQPRVSGDNNNIYSLVALIDGQIVGQIGLHLDSSARRKHVSNLGMAVSESHRGKGIGSALLSEVINLAENWLAITRIELEVYTDNLAAIALYKKHGFEIEGTAKNYAFRDGKFVDSHFMSRLKL